VTTLTAERRRPLEIDDGQESLFGGEPFAAAGTTVAWERPTRPAEVAPPTHVPVHSAGEELVALEEATEAGNEMRAARAPRTPLAGPTLDDVMSRVWEGLGVGVSAACPVCDGEVVPSVGGAHGQCSTCRTTIE
jgi:hypothetical protein